MSKTKITPIPVKANGVRNELKEIRKSIDKLTNAILLAQTHKHEKSSSIDVASSWMHIAENNNGKNDS
jgi:hypothetical protein